jgi:hypothetical protein
MQTPDPGHRDGRFRSVVNRGFQLAHAAECPFELVCCDRLLQSFHRICIQTLQCSRVPLKHVMNI